jgi:hypothetical protein
VRQKIFHLAGKQIMLLGTVRQSTGWTSTSVVKETDRTHRGNAEAGLLR